MVQQGLKLFMMVFGCAYGSNITFLDRLKNRLKAEEGSSEDESDVIIAFVTITSRAGTDIEAALRRIPESHQNVVLVVLHHTFDPHSTPDSRACVNRSNVFTVDCLFHEDRGLLTCMRNDEALKAVTDHLIFIAAGDPGEPIPASYDNPAAPKRCPPWYWIFFLLLVAVFGIVILVLILQLESK